MSDIVDSRSDSSLIKQKSKNFSGHFSESELHFSFPIIRFFPPYFWVG